MKRLIITLSVCIIGLISVLVACNENPIVPEPEQQDVLTVMEPIGGIAINADGGTVSVKIKTNCNWTATAQDDWVSLSRVSGTASIETFDVTVRPNRGDESRSSRIVVKAGKKTAEISVTQTPPVVIPTELNVTESYEFDYEGGTVKVEFTTNKEWMVFTTKPWISVSVSSGDSNEAVFDLAVEKNPSTESRSGYLTVAAGDKSAAIAVTQAGAPESQLDIDTELSFGYGGGSLTVDFTTDENWTASTEAGWLTIDPASGTPENASFKLTATANGESQKRTAEVVITAGNKTVKVNVGQDAVPASGGLRVETDGNVPWGRSTLTVRVVSSTDWTVTLLDEGEEWFSVGITTEGVERWGSFLRRKASDTSFDISYSGLDGYESHSRTFEITAGDETVYFILCQAGHPVTELTVDKEVVLGPKADTFALDFKSSFDWQASANVPWITLSATEGQPKAGYWDETDYPTECHLDISVPDYDRGVKRVGVVTITSGGKTVDVIVTQTGVEVVEFECDVFKGFCLSRYDSNHDGELDTKEAQAITEINVSCMDITSLKGIECMPNLTVIEARETKLKSVKITRVIPLLRIFNFSDSEVAGVVDLSNCPRLDGIAADNNKITGLIINNEGFFRGMELRNNCLTGVLDMSGASDDADFFGVNGNPDLKEVIVKDEKFVDILHCDEGVKVTVKH